MSWIHVSIPVLDENLFLFRISNSCGDVNSQFLLIDRILGVKAKLMTIELH